MGKSDSFIFQEYKDALSAVFPFQVRSVAFLGFSQENALTRLIQCETRHFYDLSLKNWNINDDWQLSQNYDLIICTRCAYFAKYPEVFIDKCKNYLNQYGYALVDWGLGDHWRFENYKVGWIRENEQEFAYENDNFLYSCFWNEELLKHSDVKSFWNAVKSNEKFCYSKDESLSDVIKREVPSVISYNTKVLKTKFLWPESPQLYIITVLSKD